MEQTGSGAVSAARHRAQPFAQADAGADTLVEVWGDTVATKHLAWSVLLGIAISLGAFEAGRLALASFVQDAAIARAYAMLIGLGGCLLAGALCACLFKPKRTVIEHAADGPERDEALRQLAEASGGLGSVSDLSPSARAEMEELGLLDLFASYEASSARARTGGR
ncbi:hypothetical protein [Burkholderia anthina]|uniref:hypothetical protein n=1 Tax=Burkholderia anthina TaxID=179879 RepID=UPI00158E7AEA|nr:hypothetical protein [Burkholderia anthina]